MKNWKCPLCTGFLDFKEKAYRCVHCRRDYPVQEGIPNFFVVWETPIAFRSADIVSEASVEQLARETGADTLSISELANPRQSIAVRWAKLGILSRILSWVLLGCGFAFQSSRLIGVSLVLFVSDWVFLWVCGRIQYKREIAQLLKFSREGRFHPKDIVEPLPDADQPDIHEVAENRRDDIVTALSGLSLQGQEVLHVGCGGEHDADVAEVYRKKGALNTGIDIYRPSLISFRRIFNADVALAEALRLPFADDSFDFVNATDVIEHVYDPARLLSECRRVLKPNGHILLITPNRGRMRRHFGFLNPLWFIQTWIGSHFPIWMPPKEMMAFHREFVYFHTSFTPVEMQRLVASAGLRMEWLRIKAYRGGYKRWRRYWEKCPGLHTLNDSLFAMLRKPSA